MKVEIGVLLAACATASAVRFSTTTIGMRAGRPHMNVKQAAQIEVGTKLPLGYLEIVSDDCAYDDNCQLDTTEDFFGKGKSILVGMPGGEP